MPPVTATSCDTGYVSSTSYCTSDASVKPARNMASLTYSATRLSFSEPERCGERVMLNRWFLVVGGGVQVHIETIGSEKDVLSRSRNRA